MSDEVTQKPCPDPYPWAAIDEAVRAQRSIVNRWGQYAVQSIERLQAGDFELRSWIGGWRDLATGTTSDYLTMVRALSRARGRDV